MSSSTSSSEVPRGWRRYPMAGLTALVLFVCLDRWVTFERLTAWRDESHIPNDLIHLEHVAGFGLKPLKKREPGVPVIYFVGTSQIDCALNRMVEVESVDGRPVRVEDLAAGFHTAPRQIMVQPEFESPPPDVVIYMLCELNVCGAPSRFNGKYLPWHTGVLREHLATVAFDRLARDVGEYEELALNSLSNIYRYRKLILWRFEDYARWHRLDVPMAEGLDGERAASSQRPVSVSHALAAAVLKAGFMLLGPRYRLGEWSPGEARCLEAGGPERVPEVVMRYVRHHIDGVHLFRFGHIPDEAWGYYLDWLRCVQYGQVNEEAMKYYEIMIRRWLERGAKVMVIRGLVSPELQFMIHPKVSSAMNDFLRCFCERLGATYVDRSDFTFDPADFTDPVHVGADSPSAHRFHDYVLRKCLDLIDRKPGAATP